MGILCGPWLARRLGTPFVLLSPEVDVVASMASMMELGLPDMAMAAAAGFDGRAIFAMCRVGGGLCPLLPSGGREEMLGLLLGRELNPSDLVDELPLSCLNGFPLLAL